MINVVANRYAEALFQIGEEEKLTDKLYQELSEVVGLIETNNDLFSILKSPVISKKEKISLIDNIFEDKINITFAFFIYYFSFYNLSLNILRQIMAILIIFLSYRFVLNKKLISFLITILISYSFHSTGIVGIALYPIHWFINKKNFRKPATFLIIAGGLLIVFGYRFIFTIFAKYGLLSFERYIHYFEDEDVGGRYVRLLYWSLILFFIIWRGKSSIKENKNLYSMEIYLILSFLFSLLMFFGSSWIIRVSYYFDIFLVLYMPLLAKNTGFKILENKYDGYLQVGILVIFYWLVTFIIRNGGFTYPYVFMIN